MTELRFSDGIRTLALIPSVEGAAVIRAALEEAAARAVPVTARSAAGVGGRLAEARRGLRHGIRSILAGDVGVLATLGRIRAADELPAELVLNAATPQQLGANTINLCP